MYVINVGSILEDYVFGPSACGYLVDWAAVC